ncbi:MAG TPA: hypothetical protein VG406_15390 [Isosphaeraceae bacterium]|jgi:hypothetical protein|nr:hypothetical protein [Isosphaeraceae bacterium]
MANDHKRELRERKRQLKRKGNQRVRRILKRGLAEDPENAADLAADYGRYRSADLNGLDADPARREQALGNIP